MKNKKANEPNQATMWAIKIAGLVLLCIFFTACAPKSGTLNAVVVGDSIANNLFQSGYLESIKGYDWHNSAIPGQEAEQVWARWQADVDSFKPHLVVLMVGTNNVLRGKDLDSLKVAYKQIFADLERLHSRVVILNLGPNTTPAGVTDDVNLFLSEQVSLHKNFSLVDFHSMAMNSVESYDGIHLHATGAKEVIQMIQKTLSKE